MFGIPLGSKRGRFFIGVLLAVAVAAAASVLLLGSAPLRAQITSLPEADHHHAPAMTADQMTRWIKDFYSAHPRRGVNSGADAADTFLALGTNQFDADGDPTGTPQDTARIFVGESILWQYAPSAFPHTTTNGTDLSDPQAGTLWDQELSSTSPSFTFTFNNAGTFPFFCRPHVDMGMKGVVIVQAPAGIVPVPGSGSSGFTAGPSPNPTAAGATFRFALTVAGQARAAVYDARGRLVATVLERHLEAGAYAADWDGRTRAGMLAASGVYYLRLSVPGLAESRRIVVKR